MSLEKALAALEDGGFKDPSWAVGVIQEAKNQDELTAIMLRDKTSLSACQFVSFRMNGFFSYDPDFAQMTVHGAYALSEAQGLPCEIVYTYVSSGGGVDTAIVINGCVYLGHMPGKGLELKPFFEQADRYLFERMREYVDS